MRACDSVAPRVPARRLLRRHSTCRAHGQMPPFNSAIPADCIERNFVGGRTRPASHACTCPQPYAYAHTRVPVVKDFIVMNLIFIQTVLAVLPRALFLPFSPPPSFHPSLSHSSFSLSPSLVLFASPSLPRTFSSTSFSSTAGNTRRTERYVPMQTWFAGYLEWNKGGELSSTAPYPGWLSVIQ